MEEPSGGVWDVPAYHLTRVLDEGIREEAALVGEGEGPPTCRSRVAMRRSGEESPVRWRGELLGFAEAMGEAVSGTVALSRGALTFTPDPRPPGSQDAHGPAAGGQEEEIWPLLEIRAIQTSSSSLQFSPVGGGLVELRFPSDSPYRWESLLRHAVRRTYREAGLGEIVEFQPRIVTESPENDLDQHGETGAQLPETEAELPETEAELRGSRGEGWDEDGPGGERRGET